MAYLEQSTRYISYDERLANGRYRYYRDPEVLDSPLGARYVGDMDRMFDSYAELLAPMQSYFVQSIPKSTDDSDFAYRTSIRAKALDALRGLLPIATISNLGIYGTGQGYEAMVLRMRAHPLPEARAYAQIMLKELRKVIPSFLKRVDRPDRGVAWSSYFETNRVMMEEVADTLFGKDEADPADTVTLSEFDPDGENKVVAAMLYPYTHLPESQIVERVSHMSAEEKSQIVRAYVGQRGNRRHKPGRALERISYRFDLCTDYGTFKDLMRHRMLTIEWQAPSPENGYRMPDVVGDAGLGNRYSDAMDRMTELYHVLRDAFPTQAQYALTHAHRIRYAMQLNAREAMHMLELRSSPQGHPQYRRVAQQMHQQIAEHAGHRVIAEMMTYVDHEDYDLGRLGAERRAEERRKASPESA
jgi:thymidylate synthase ThyX